MRMNLNNNKRTTYPRYILLRFSLLIASRISLVTYVFTVINPSPNSNPFNFCSTREMDYLACDSIVCLFASLLNTPNLPKDLPNNIPNILSPSFPFYLHCCVIILDIVLYVGGGGESLFDPHLSSSSSSDIYIVLLFYSSS